MQRLSLAPVLIVVLSGFVQSASAQSAPSRDGVEIRYSAVGSGEPALVFIHGGFVDRTYWASQLSAFSKDHRVIALDLAGHGESGSDRKNWTLELFGADVCAVMQKEKVGRAVLIGNSMGGPVALEAARQAPGRVVGVIGIDTFQNFTQPNPPSGVEERAKAFRENPSGTMKAMVRMLLHKDTDPALIARIEQDMTNVSGEFAAAVTLCFSGYDYKRAVKEAKVPVRAINGDLFPTEVQKNRSVAGSFEAVILPHVGHYPMLETPELFNRVLAGLLTEWKKSR